MGDHQIKCKYCGRAAAGNGATAQCDRCWEIGHRVGLNEDPELVARIVLAAAPRAAQAIVDHAVNPVSVANVALLVECSGPATAVLDAVAAQLPQWKRAAREHEARADLAERDLQAMRDRYGEGDAPPGGAAPPDPQLSHADQRALDAMRQGIATTIEQMIAAGLPAAQPNARIWIERVREGLVACDRLRTQARPWRAIALEAALREALDGWASCGPPMEHRDHGFDHTGGRVAELRKLLEGGPAPGGTEG